MPPSPSDKSLGYFQPSASRTKRYAPTGYETFCAKQLLFAESPADISSHRYRLAILCENGIPRPESEIADPGVASKRSVFSASLLRLIHHSFWEYAYVFNGRESDLTQLWFAGTSFDLLPVHGY